MSRAIACCDDAVVGDLLAYARHVDCLSVDRYKDPRIQSEMCRCLVAAGKRWQEELGSPSGSNAGLVRSIQRLIDHAEAFNREMPA
jgi:hypothetical protein